MVVPANQRRPVWRPADSAAGIQRQTRLPCPDRGARPGVYYRDSRGAGRLSTTSPRLCRSKRVAKIDDCIEEHLNGQLPKHCEKVQPLP